MISKQGKGVTPTVLTDGDHAFWQEHGYLVVPDVVPLELCAAVRADIINYLGLDPAASVEDYYEKVLAGDRSGFVNLNQSQALWDTRQHPRLHQVFSHLPVLLIPMSISVPMKARCITRSPFAVQAVHNLLRPLIMRGTYKVARLSGLRFPYPGTWRPGPNRIRCSGGTTRPIKLWHLGVTA